MDYGTRRKAKVLLVDDDEEDFFIVKKQLDSVHGKPYTVEWISEFDIAIKTIQKNKHDVYLIDYRLGAQSGLDLLHKVRPAKRTEPFILLTGAGDREIEWKSMKLAASDYLVKGSFNADMLARTIDYSLQRKQAEEQRVKHYIELNRNKDEFISIASHQLRTPATGVKQYLGMLLEGFAGELEVNQLSMVRKAYQSNERQLKIVSDLLKVAQVDAGKVMINQEVIDIREIMSEVVRELEGVFRSRNQTVRVNPSNSELNVFIDKDTIQMVMDNIVDNASKYSEENKSVEISFNENDRYIQVLVTDHGVGISTVEKDKLFEKFSRINNPLSTKVGGTGLGLYWAKKIVDLHDGKIEVKSKKAEGTTFIISLPKPDYS